MIVLAALEEMFQGFAGPTRSENNACLKVYCARVKDSDVRDILNAIDAFNTGKVAGASTKFAPSAPQLSVETEVQRDRREHKERHRAVVWSKTTSYVTAFHRKLKAGLIPPLGKGNYRYTGLDALNTLAKMPF